MAPPLNDLSGIVCRGCNARLVLNERRAAYAMSPCLFPSCHLSPGYPTLFREEYGVADLPARSSIFRLDLFPERQRSQLEFRKFLSDFPQQAFFLRFARTPTASRKHP